MNINDIYTQIDFKKIIIIKYITTELDQSLFLISFVFLFIAWLIEISIKIIVLSSVGHLIFLILGLAAVFISFTKKNKYFIAFLVYLCNEFNNKQNSEQFYTNILNLTVDELLLDYHSNQKLFKHKIKYIKYCLIMDKMSSKIDFQLKIKLHSALRTIEDVYRLIGIKYS